MATIELSMVEIKELEIVEQHFMWCDSSWPELEMVLVQYMSM